MRPETSDTGIEAGIEAAARTSSGGSAMHAEVIETHMSVLFFYGAHVLKVRKPVSYGFADFRDPEERRADCSREVELNRRLAPDVYVGTASVLVDDRTVEHAVVMRRLPPTRNLAAIVASGEDASAELELVAEVLARFHEGARRSPAISASATSDALWQRWQATEEELSRFIGTAVDGSDYRRLVSLAQRFLRGWGELFERRIATGRICDGHGDLQAADVFCLPDGPRLLDCLEFDDTLRHGDVLADAAFLVQDLERMGADAASRSFFDAYRKSSGTDQPEALLHFYVAARAHVRLLVECLRLEQGLQAPAPDPSRILAQALAHLEAAIPRLVLVGGLPGTGKSSLATWIGEQLGATVLSTDHERRTDPSAPRGPSPFGSGQYTYERRRGVYEQLLQRSAALLHDARSVVLDATWSNAEFRQLAAAVARSTSTTLVELECRCAPEERTRRILARHGVEAVESDATPAAADALAEVADPWPTAHVVDTSGPVDLTRKAVLEVLHAEMPGHAAPMQESGRGSGQKIS